MKKRVWMLKKILFLSSSVTQDTAMRDVAVSVAVLGQILTANAET